MGFNLDYLLKAYLDNHLDNYQLNYFEDYILIFSKTRVGKEISYDISTLSIN